MERYQGKKKATILLPSPPNMSNIDRSTASVIFLCAKAEDLQFFRSIISNEQCPEYYGFNVKNWRVLGIATKKKTQVIYKQLIHMKPSDPETIKMAILRATETYLLLLQNQNFVVLTYDQQLYAVALNVIWTEPERFSDIVLRLGVGVGGGGGGCIWQ